MENKKIVCIGGGTGLSTMLRGLKAYTKDLTAIVTVSDNGGHSGNLRKEMKILPPGDLRNCLLALAEAEPMLEALFAHRFSEGSLKGYNLGNLLIVGLVDLYGNFGAAIEKAHEVLRVRGQVLPVTTEDVQLKAIYDDESEIVGECEIVSANKSHKKYIKEMKLMPSQPKVYKNVLEKIEEADIIILGPGSLYTSIIPNLLVEGVCDALRDAKGKIVYVGNIMTQPGETEGFTLLEHVNIIEQYIGVGMIDKIIANDGWPEAMVIEHYNQDGAELVLPLIDDNRLIAVPMIALNEETGYVRHDSRLLAQTIMSIG
ncbi:gluconeogenesis morphogenetic factor (UDP-sugar binding) [Petrocella atlantisensis]|uniref:Putative gluconeogenesis factor n=1 Tax=Petrocella atlantisensis TaxID=2173034 RepID=A0A3P7PB27_9FIRM|nr:gluconeogenesis factor YvcK family protein [Petrocella atlantisensis]VDN47383.1 gluconeogenesis morphogenetic factor (UDP-sugar binding) [Petrocella atlantisensis]